MKEFVPNPKVDLKKNQNTLTITLDLRAPGPPVTYMRMLCELDNMLDMHEKSGKYIDGIAAYYIRPVKCKSECLDPKNYDSITGTEKVFAFYTTHIKKPVYQTITYKNLHDLLCDMECLPADISSKKVFTVVYTPVDNLLLVYRGTCYPFEKELSRIKQIYFASLVKTLEPVANYPRINQAIHEVLAVLVQDPELKHAKDIRFYVSATVPGYSSISTRDNDLSDRTIPELRNSIVFASRLETTLDDKDLFANVARAIVSKALQIYSVSGITSPSDINLCLTEKFGIIAVYFCPNCKQMLIEDFIKCPNCGARLASPEQEKAIRSSKNKKFLRYFPQ
ncbi:MAG: hypothetical protein J7L42_00210 [Elusimicrobia bacterium]|nr:hypothetical protein [Elusimicrobiota bacterium]